MISNIARRAHREGRSDHRRGNPDRWGRAGRRDRRTAGSGTTSGSTTITTPSPTGPGLSGGTSAGGAPAVDWSQPCRTALQDPTRITSTGDLAALVQAAGGRDQVLAFCSGVLHPVLNPVSGTVDAPAGSAAGLTNRPARPALRHDNRRHDGRQQR